MFRLSKQHNQNRKKYIAVAYWADPALLAEIRHIAETEGRQLQSVLEEAMREFIERRKSGKPNPVAMSHFQASMQRNHELYKRLAH